MDAWGWEQLDAVAELRAALPVGPLFCVLRGPTRGRLVRRPGSAPSCTAPPRAAGVRRRFAPHQLRHAHAVEMPAKGSRCRDPAPARARRPGRH